MCRSQGAAITSIAWHPHHEDLWVSGGMDGSLAYWLTDADDEPQLVFKAHDVCWIFTSLLFSICWHRLLLHDVRLRLSLAHLCWSLD